MATFSGDNVSVRSTLLLLVTIFPNERYDNFIIDTIFRQNKLFIAYISGDDNNDDNDGKGNVM